MAISLKAARVNADLTQIDAAKQLGIGVDLLRKFENGEGFPTLDVLKKIEKLYGLSYNDIKFVLPENE